MDQAISQFLSAGTLVLVLSIIILTFFIRRIIETAFPHVKKQADENSPKITYLTTTARWYQQVILYAIPVVVGGCLGILDVPYLFSIEGLTTTGSKVFFGGVSGWMSSFVYKVFRQVLKKKTGVDLPSVTVPPPSEDGVLPPPEGQ